MQTYVRPQLVKVSQNTQQIENIENSRIFTTHACMSGLSMPYTVPDLVQLLHFSVFGYFNDS